MVAITARSLVNVTLFSGTAKRLGDLPRPISSCACAELLYTRLARAESSMTNRRGRLVRQFPVREDLVRKMRWAFIPITFYIVLFAFVVVFAYDFESASQGTSTEQTIFYGSILAVFAVIAFLAWNTWRKIPRSPNGAGLVISADGVTDDYGNGPTSIDPKGVTGIVAVAVREGQTPEAVVFCRDPTGDLSIRNRNRVMHKVGWHIARVSQFRGQDVLPLALFGEDQASDIITALRGCLEERTEPHG